MARQINPAFQAAAAKLRELGWLPYMEPQLLWLDDTWIFRLRTDRLDYLFVSESDLRWDRKRFSQEPFGDYTNAFQPKGNGVGAESLLKGGH